jgi:hypothetical protein
MVMLPLSSYHHNAPYVGSLSKDNSPSRQSNYDVKSKASTNTGKSQKCLKKYGHGTNKELVGQDNHTFHYLTLHRFPLSIVRLTEERLHAKEVLQAQ